MISLFVKFRPAILKLGQVLNMLDNGEFAVLDHCRDRGTPFPEIRLNSIKK